MCNTDITNMYNYLVSFTQYTCRPCKTMDTIYSGCLLIDKIILSALHSISMGATNNK